MEAEEEGEVEEVEGDSACSLPQNPLVSIKSGAEDHDGSRLEQNLLPSWKALVFVTPRNLACPLTPIVRPPSHLLQLQYYASFLPRWDGNFEMRFCMLESRGWLEFEVTSSFHYLVRV